MAIVITDNPIITLTTDFGLDDNYIGIIKGIISGVNSKANLIDISHNVPPFNIEAACYLIETSYQSFPAGSIHLAVIDPGVGLSRRAILIETDNYFFIGPDNGLFSFLKRREIKKIISLTDKKYFLGEISSTFHGRDIFAPVAGFLSAGVSPDEFGSPLKSMSRFKTSTFRKTRKGLTGKIIYIDHFGNLASSIRAEKIPDTAAKVFLNGKEIGPIRKTFGNVKAGRPVCYVNSFGYLEVGINQGSAADYFGVDYSTKSEILIASD